MTFALKAALAIAVVWMFPLGVALVVFAEPTRIVRKPFTTVNEIPRGYGAYFRSKARPDRGWMIITAWHDDCVELSNWGVAVTPADLSEGWEWTRGPVPNAVVLECLTNVETGDGL